MANIAMFMQKLNEDNERKKAEQDRLLRDIESSQSQSKVFRPMAQFIDFLSNANPYQKGTALTENQPKSIDEQRINTALAGYTIPDNDEMLKLLKMQQEGAGGGFSANERLRAQGMYDNLIKKDIEDMQTVENGLVSIKSFLSSPNIQTLGVFLSQFARAVAGEKGVLTDRDITRIMPENLAKKFSTWDQFFTASADEIGKKGSLPKEYFDVYGKLLRDVEKEKGNTFKKRIQEKTEVAKLGAIGEVLGNKTLDAQAEKRLAPYKEQEEKKQSSLDSLVKLLGE